jgi:hypothetical protein
MNHRWCIIAGPRSGSRWLEDSIWAHFYNITKFAIRLGEFIHPDLNGSGSMILGKSKILLHSSSSENNKSKDLQLLLNHQTDLIINSNLKQPMTMRVFCQDWNYSADEYLDFFQKIRNCGFNFISLDRNIFDRAISWYVMEHTGIHHRFMRDENDMYTSNNGEQFNVTTEKITVDINEFLSRYNQCKTDTRARLDMEYMLSVKKVSYDNLVQNCIDNNIPISKNISIKKLYDVSYQDKIDNWDELLEAVKPLLVEEIYE